MTTLQEFTRSLARLPRMIVLDIDYTLWPFGVHTQVTPFKSDGNGGACDSHGGKMILHKDVRLILHDLESIGIPIAAASRTEDPAASRELLSVLELDTCFKYLEIFPSRKFAHFENIRRDSGVDYKEMLFFDDEERNIRDISAIGVTCIHVDHDVGLDYATLKEGLHTFSGNRNS